MDKWILFCGKINFVLWKSIDLYHAKVDLCRGRVDLCGGKDFAVAVMGHRSSILRQCRTLFAVLSLVLIRYAVGFKISSQFTTTSLFKSPYLSIFSSLILHENPTGLLHQ